MKISIEKRAEWIPQFEENLALPESEQIRISYDKPLAYKRSEWSKTIATKGKSGTIETYIDIDRAKVIKDSNVSIVNLSIVEDGKERQIGSGDDLLSCRSDVCYALVEMLVNSILKNDFQAELKN